MPFFLTINVKMPLIVGILTFMSRKISCLPGLSMKIFYNLWTISIKTLRNSFFSGSDTPRMLFFLFINVEMPTVVGILTFVSRKKSMLSELSMNFL